MDEQDVQRLAVDIYQLADDQLFRKSRTDGAGWDWSWADFQRDWMSATPFRHAYRCLPLTIVNQTGWWVQNPVGFTAYWQGAQAPGSISFEFDSPDPVWSQWINSQFGEGIITWNTPFMFRTKPVGSRLLITGPTNYFRKNVQSLTALIESDWMTMSFTMNYKIITPHEPVRFEVGEPLFQAIPLISNVSADLEAAEVRYQKLTDDPVMFQAYVDWSTARTEFHKSKARREVRIDDWQKDYFQGRDAAGRAVATEHKTKLKPPKIHYRSTPVSEPPTEQTARAPRADEPARAQAESRTRQPAGRGSDLGRPGKFNGLADLDAVLPAIGRIALATQRGTRAPAHGDIPASCPMGFSSQIRPQQPVVSAGPTGGIFPAPTRRQQEIGMKKLARTSKRFVRTQAPSPGADPAATRTHRIDPVTKPSRIDDNHRRWIAENLFLESPPQMIFEALVGAGIDGEAATAEIQLALASPYLLGANLLRNRLQKREWLLATYRKLNRLHPESTAIPRKHRLSRAEFLAEHYSTNRPVIITGMMEDWPALQKWNLDFFANSFGDREIEVQIGRNSSANYEIEREKYLKKIGFGQFVEMVRTAGQTNDFYLTANNNSRNKQVLPELWNDIVQIPEYLDASDPMSGFFWMGPAGTVTPFHHDLTNNFMVQVVGHKKVKIAPSWDMPLMRNHFHVFSQVDGRGLTPQISPPIDHPQVIECLLGPGEILFLPIGCLHYVEGMEVSVTVSFTNFVFDNDFSSFYKTYHQV